MQRLDLILRGGRVVNPANATDTVGDVGIRAGLRQALLDDFARAIPSSQTARWATSRSRPLLWNGGDLFVNPDTRGGYLTVRVTDYNWNEIEGFGFHATARFTGDAVRHRVRWGDRSLHELAGQYVRLEFAFVHADLFAFAAGREEGTR